MQSNKKEITANDFFIPTPFNNETKNQIWMSIIADGHDSVCHCNSPFAHLFANIFPPGHKDRDLTINQILERDIKHVWHSGGDAGTSHGTVAGGTGGGFKPVDAEGAEEDFHADELEELIAAAEEKENTR